MIPLLLLLLQGNENPQVPKVPDDVWGGWWPKAQWSRSDPPPTVERARSVSRAWKAIHFGRLPTPWGEAWAQALPEADGFRLSLSFNAGRLAIEKGEFPDPKEGDLEASLVRGAEVVAKNTKIQGIGAWVGNDQSMTGTLAAEFPWLSSDLRDVWVRFRLKESTMWFLLPYGLSSDPAKPLTAFAAEGGAPARPSGAGEGDRIVGWTRVDYDLGWIDPKGAVHDTCPPENRGWTHVMARISNPFDGACTLELYRDADERWNLSRPRTTVAVGVPGRQVVFSRGEGIRRDESYRRHDDFGLWRHGGENRTWGLLRVTVEDQVFERLLPGSLFLYTQGRCPK